VLTKLEILEKLPTATKEERRELLKLARELDSDPIVQFKNQIIHGDCFEILKSIPDGSIDAVITDPPYGIGLAKWDTVIDIPLFTKEVKRVTNGFYSFFGQMPTMVNWINAANDERLHYCEHISWVKRKEMPVQPRLKRKHESIFIYALDSGKKYFKQTGRYEDVKVPGILFDVVTIQAVQRTISDLKTGRPSRITELNHLGQFSNSKRKLGREHRSIDTDNSNYTNVWSFLPPIFSDGRCQKQSYVHPTEKPLEIMKRLVEMLTPEGGTVLDPFAGSGTTAIACKELGRNYICIEKELEYYQIAKQRIEATTKPDKS
jgi:site-specific DNA-methyltransferase (adenine-specific)